MILLFTGVALVFSLLIVILFVRFLWMVPDELRDIKHYLMKLYNSKNND